MSLRVPFAMVSSLVTATITGWAVIITIAFCMGSDVLRIVTSPLGQPLAQIAFNILGTNGSKYFRSLECLKSHGTFAVSEQKMLTSHLGITLLVLLWFSKICNCSILMVAASGETFAFARDHGSPAVPSYASFHPAKRPPAPSDSSPSARLPKDFSCS